MFLPRLLLSRNFTVPPRSASALLFNSDVHANTDLFASVPQPHGTALYDVAIDASIQDIMRASRVTPVLRRAFTHDDTSALLAAALLVLRSNAPY
jgi:7-keto-8-aminopelargonate synthetase-like enzyme